MQAAVPEEAKMKVGEAIAEILKREGIEIITGYPVNHVLEYAAAADIRPVIVRQERVGLHIADAISRMTSGRKLGVFAMQHGPGAENSFGGVAQAYGESVPLLVLPMGYARRLAYIDPNFSSVNSMRSVSKSAEPIMSAAEIPNIFRRAFLRLRNGRGGPVIVEIPNDLFAEEIPGPLEYEPVITARYGPDVADLKQAAETLVNAKRLVIYAGQGVHYARAWEPLKKSRSFWARRYRQACKEKVRSTNTILCLWGREPGVSQNSPLLPAKCGLDFRRWLQLHGNRLWHCHAQRQEIHPCHPRSKPSE